MTLLLSIACICLASVSSVEAVASTYYQGLLIGPKSNISSTQTSLTAFAPYLGYNTVNIHFNVLHKSFALGLDGLVTNGNTPYTTLSAGVPLQTILTGGQATYGPGAFIQASMLWNHNIYWQSLSSPGQGGSPSANLTTLINQSFGNSTNLLNLFLAPVASNYFGSGWVWLVRVRNSNQLQVVQTHDTSAIDVTKYYPLLVIDVWEHAYYLDYNATKSAYVTNALSALLNWNFANMQLTASPSATDIPVMQNRTIFPAATTQLSFDSQVVGPTFAYGALLPYISYNTVNIHYNKHHKSYASKLDSLVANGNPGYASIAGVNLKAIVASVATYGTAAVNSAGQLLNHNLYWSSLAPPGTGGSPSNQLNALFAAAGYNKMSEIAAEVAAASNILGSGWVWLVYNPSFNVVSIQSTADGGTYIASGSQFVPLLVLDVWEHAYYLDYNASAAMYFNNTLNYLTNWNYANAVLANSTVGTTTGTTQGATTTHAPVVSTTTGSTGAPAGSTTTTAKAAGNVTTTAKSTKAAAGNLLFPWALLVGVLLLSTSLA